MREIVILIPEVDKDQNVEIDVRINGRKKTISYRVELLEWEGDDCQDRVTTLRRKINAYDKNWELVEIGAPTNKEIPIIFKNSNID